MTDPFLQDPENVTTGSPAPSKPFLGGEPTLIIQGIVAALNAGQVAALNAPSWVHVVILVLVTGLGAIVNRQAVTPA